MSDEPPAHGILGIVVPNDKYSNYWLIVMVEHLLQGGANAGLPNCRVATEFLFRKAGDLAAPLLLQFLAAASGVEFWKYQGCSVGPFEVETNHGTLQCLKWTLTGKQQMKALGVMLQIVPHNRYCRISSHSKFPFRYLGVSAYGVYLKAWLLGTYDCPVIFGPRNHGLQGVST